jgi:hypothetical protein
MTDKREICKKDAPESLSVKTRKKPKPLTLPVAWNPPCLETPGIISHAALYEEKQKNTEKQKQEKNRGGGCPMGKGVVLYKCVMSCSVCIPMPTLCFHEAEKPKNWKLKSIPDREGKA